MNQSTSSEPSLDEGFFIGTWLIQPRLNQISSGGRVHEIEPKMMRVLVCLAQQPGMVLSHAQLMDTVWPDTVVGEKSLAGVISKLRKVFDDDPYDPRVIKTISKHGYRLIAPVSHTGAVQEDFGRNGAHVLPEVGRSPRPSLGSATPMPASSHRGFVVVVVTVLVVALIGGGIAWILGQTTPRPAMLASAIALTTYPGHEINPALSPDGDAVAFAWAGTDGDNWDLYIQQVGAEIPLRRTDDPAYDLQPTWSPDGTQIAFTRYTDNECSIYVLPALAGAARKLAACAEHILPGGFVFFRPNLSWSPDGRTLVFPYRENAQQPFSLYELSLESLERQRLTNPPASFLGDYSPAWSPDGRSVAFTRRQARRSADLYVYSLEHGTEQRLTFDYRSLLGLDWARDGRYLVFSSERGSTYDLWRIPASGGQLEWIPTTGWNVKDPSLARQGADRMVYENWFYDNNLWRLSLSDEVAGPPPSASSFLASTLRETQPQYSPEGTHVAFISNRSGSYEVWVADSSGTASLQLTAMDGPIVGAPRWSPDGTHIVFEARPRGQADIYTVDRQNGKVRRLTTSEADETLASWSPDGDWLYFSSNRSGAWQVWRMPMQGGNAEQVTQEGGYAALVSANSQLLYYTKHGQPGLWRISGDGSSEQLVLSTLQSGDWGNWTLTQEGIYFVERTTTPRLALYRFSTQRIEHVVALSQAPMPNQLGLTVSPDGHWLLYTQLDQTESDLMVVESTQ